MNINAPVPALYPQLKSLWQQAFGDTPAFIDGFFAKGFSPERCRCIAIDGAVAAALYWFDAKKDGENFAYIYAVATEKSHRGQGLCRRLMTDTHSHLQSSGYTGAVLVPAEPGLWDYYSTMGYRPFGRSDTFAREAAAPIALEQISAREYLAQRNAYLPQSSLDETQSICYYGTWGNFYRGSDCLFAAAIDDGVLYAQEFLGDPAQAGAVVAALACEKGHFRTPGSASPCGMYLLFAPAEAPDYLGFPLD